MPSHTPIEYKLLDFSEDPADYDASKALEIQRDLNAHVGSQGWMPSGMRIGPYDVFWRVKPYDVRLQDDVGDLQMSTAERGPDFTTRGTGRAVRPEFRS